MDIDSIVAALGAHNWLLLVMLVAVYARTLFSSQSKFPWNLSPNWLPVFSGIAGFVVVVDTSLMGGKTVGPAILIGVVGFVSGGFADGLIVALFGDSTKAPTWAKALIFLVDDVFGHPGGGVSVKKTETVEVHVDAVTKEADKLTTPYRLFPNTSTRLDFFSIAFKRLTVRLAGVAIVVGFFAVGASTGASCTVTPQSQAEINAAIVLGDCIESTYATDSQKVPAPTPIQIAVDEGTICAADAAQLAQLFMTSSDAGKVAVAKAAQDHPEVVAQAKAQHQAKH
jgi:hypothetical protein